MPLEALKPVVRLSFSLPNEVKKMRPEVSRLHPSLPKGNGTGPVSRVDLRLSIFFPEGQCIFRLSEVKLPGLTLLWPCSPVFAEEPYSIL